jgi:N-acetylneuraminic acid mutarotase
MKKIFPLFCLQFIMIGAGNAQATWTQKADLAGPARENAVAFSIGNKGYVCTGAIPSYPYYLKDLWQYDPQSDAWTQKADLAGSAREYAVAFSIGNKGYVGTGYSGFPAFQNLKDLWEYDTLLNSWMQKADYGGGARWDAVGFSIGDKGYIGTGSDTSGSQKDFWEYDPTSDAWLQKTDFGGTAREQAVGFSIGNKGYIGTGYATDGYKKDFWEFDPVLNLWTQKADFGGTARWLAVGFGTVSKGYIGTGADLSYLPYLTDFWEYDPISNAWNQQPDFGGAGRYDAIAFNVGDYGYVGTGAPVTGGFAKDFWEYAPQTIGIPAVHNPGLRLSVFPDPAMDFATIQFTTNQPSHVLLKLCAVSGKEIETMVNDELQPGDHSVHINTGHLEKGFYLITMISDFGMQQQKLVVQ